MLDTRSWLHRFLEERPWAIMAIIVAISLLAALGLVRLDQDADITPRPDQVWLYGGTSESAISLLSAVASSAITVAGVVFSATFVTMQLASSQYTPRVVQALSRRWALQVVLGLFLGNFVYSLIVLRSVRPPDANGAGEFIPVISVSICVVYSVACAGVLVYYIAYGMRSLQPTFLIDSAARETVNLLERSRRVSKRVQARSANASWPELDAADYWSSSVLEAGFLQHVRFRKLLSIAERENLTIRIDAEIGQYYLPGESLMRVWPGRAFTPEVEREIRECAVVGRERTPEQDIEYGFRRVTDIMLKALSPAINDPTTAEYCINRLGELIVLLAGQPAPQRFLVDDEGTVRVIWEPEPFERCVHTALGQLRFYVSRDVTLMHYSLATLERVARLVSPVHQAILMQETIKFRDTIFTVVTSPADVEELRAASAWIGSMPRTGDQSIANTAA